MPYALIPWAKIADKINLPKEGTEERKKIDELLKVTADGLYLGLFCDEDLRGSKKFDLEKNWLKSDREVLEFLEGALKDYQRKKEHEKGFKYWTGPGLIAWEKEEKQKSERAKAEKPQAASEESPASPSFSERLVASSASLDSLSQSSDKPAQSVDKPAQADKDEDLDVLDNIELSSSSEPVTGEPKPVVSQPVKVEKQSQHKETPTPKPAEGQPVKVEKQSPHKEAPTPKPAMLPTYEKERGKRQKMNAHGGKISPEKFIEISKEWIQTLDSHRKSDKNGYKNVTAKFDERAKEMTTEVEFPSGKVDTIVHSYQGNPVKPTEGYPKITVSNPPGDQTIMLFMESSQSMSPLTLETVCGEKTALKLFEASLIKGVELQLQEKDRVKLEGNPRYQQLLEIQKDQDKLKSFIEQANKPDYELGQTTIPAIGLSVGKAPLLQFTGTPSAGKAKL